MEVLSFFEEHNFDNLYFNNTFGEDESSRDRHIKELFDNCGYACKTFTDQVLFEPGSIRTIENKAYSVFTPFKRSGLRNLILIYLILSTNMFLKIKKF